MTHLKTAADGVDPSDALAHPTGHAVGHVLRGGVEGTLLGLPAAFAAAKYLPAGMKLKSVPMVTSVGTAAGMAKGLSDAKDERNYNAMLMGEKQAMDRGRAFAHALVKTAVFREVDEALGHLVSGAGAAAGKTLQAGGEAGKKLEDFASRHMDRETAGRLAGAGLLVGGGLAAPHVKELMDARGGNDDPYGYRGFPGQAPF